MIELSSQNTHEDGTKGQTGFEMFSPFSKKTEKHERTPYTSGCKSREKEKVHIILITIQFFYITGITI